MTERTLDQVSKEIRALIEEGETIADATGEHFWAGGEEYIPASSPEFQDYRWIREEHYLPDDEGFWYSSSMQSC